jgi:hypothetical protein
LLQLFDDLPKVVSKLPKHSLETPKFHPKTKLIYGPNLSPLDELLFLNQLYLYYLQYDELNEKA